MLILLMAPDAMNGARAQLSGQEIRIGVGGPLTTGSATFGVEMRQALDLAVAEKNAVGGVLGAKIVAVAADDKASNQRGEAVVRQFCDDPAVLGVVGHVNSGVTIAAAAVYAFDKILPEKLATLARIPILIVIGDRAQDRVDSSRAFERKMKAIGGEVTVDVLLEAGIKCNGHTMMLERNNKQIMFRMIAWIEGHVVSRQ